MKRIKQITSFFKKDDKTAQKAANPASQPLPEIVPLGDQFERARSNINNYNITIPEISLYLADVISEGNKCGQSAAFKAHVTEEQLRLKDYCDTKELELQNLKMQEKTEKLRLENLILKDKVKNFKNKLSSFSEDASSCDQQKLELRLLIRGKKDSLMGKIQIANVEKEKELNKYQELFKRPAMQKLEQKLEQKQIPQEILDLPPQAKILAITKLLKSG